MKKWAFWKFEPGQLTKISILDFKNEQHKRCDIAIKIRNWYFDFKTYMIFSKKDISFAG